MKKFHVHLVSDSTGGTLGSVMKASFAQFEGADPVEHLWHLIRTDRDLKRVVEGIYKNPGPVFFTLVDEALAKQLVKLCEGLNVPVLSILQPVISFLSDYLGLQSRAEPGLQHKMNEEYFTRMDAVDFAMYHDDGQKAAKDLEKADVILVGVSRTSKTPTCVYLANRGVKAANIPFVPGVPISEHILNLPTPFFVGLTVAPERLVEIRKNRLRQLGETGNTDYFDLEKVTEEVRNARRLYSSRNWPVIDVTRRSVEETAAEILSLLEKRREGAA